MLQDKLLKPMLFEEFLELMTPVILEGFGLERTDKNEEQIRTYKQELINLFEQRLVFIGQEERFEDNHDLYVRRGLNKKLYCYLRQDG